MPSHPYTAWGSRDCRCYCCLLRRAGQPPARRRFDVWIAEHWTPEERTLLRVATAAGMLAR